MLARSDGAQFCALSRNSAHRTMSSIVDLRTTPVTVEPVGRVVGGRVAVSDDDWGDVVARIRFDRARFAPEALAGLESFSHLEVLFVFDRVDAAAVETGARHPRGNQDWPRVGIFAQRAKDRPNRIGISRCRLLAVDDLELHVQGLDAIDGSPVLDVKPWMSEFAPQGETRQPVWATELMRGYW
jgi:tRNA-Thr(GGU) m(6)t(6)A37 methyltransferase TsaA